MFSPRANPIFLHLTTLFMWLIAVGSAVYWVLHINARQNANSAPVVATAKADQPDAAGLARILGATSPQAAAPVDISSRFSLKGVVSGARGKEAALIVIDNKPAQAFRVGSTVEDGLILQSAAARKVTLSTTADGPAVMTLEMPPLAK